MKLLSAFAAFTLGLGLYVQPSSAATVIYTDEATFLAALSSLASENFDDGTVDTPFSVVSTTGAVGSGVWSDVLQPATVTTTWSFNAPVNGFGGTWNLAVPGGPGVGIGLTLSLFGGGSEVVSAEIPNTTLSTFWGFISDALFTSVELYGGTQGIGIETYEVDNLTIGVAPVPVPAALPLFLAGMGAMGFMGWRRKRKAALPN